MCLHPETSGTIVLWPATCRYPSRRVEDGHSRNTAVLAINAPQFPSRQLDGPGAFAPGSRHRQGALVSPKLVLNCEASTTRFRPVLG